MFVITINNTILLDFTDVLGTSQLVCGWMRVRRIVVLLSVAAVVFKFAKWKYNTSATAVSAMVFSHVSSSLLVEVQYKCNSSSIVADSESC